MNSTRTVVVPITCTTPLFIPSEGHAFVKCHLRSSPPSRPCALMAVLREATGFMEHSLHTITGLPESR